MRAKTCKCFQLVLKPAPPMPWSGWRVGAHGVAGWALAQQVNRRSTEPRTAAVAFLCGAKGSFTSLVRAATGCLGPEQVREAVSSPPSSSIVKKRLHATGGDRDHNHAAAQPRYTRLYVPHQLITATPRHAGCGSSSTPLWVVESCPPRPSTSTST